MTVMILTRARSTGRTLAIVAVVAGVAGMFVYGLLAQHAANAAPSSLSPSVLCAPNICNANESTDSFQDVTLVNELSGQPSGERWRIQENSDANGDADRMLLEVANQDNHFMRQVVVGIYVTPDVYNAMPATKSLPLRFVKRTCNTADDPRWSVRARTPGNPSSSSLLAQYDTIGTTAERANAQSFCGNTDTVEFNLATQKSHFVSYANNLLYYVEVAITLDRYDEAHPPTRRNARFQLELDNSVCGLNDDCRQYIAIIKDSGADADGRNFAVSGRLPAPKTTTNKSESDNDPSTYDHFTRTYEQRAIRQYMEFGLPCDATSAQASTINLYDINDGDNAPPEEHGWVGGRDIVGVVLQQYNDTTSAWESVPITGSNLSSASLAPPDDGANLINTRNRSLYQLGGGEIPGTVIIPGSGDFVNTRVTFTMQPQVRYRIAITPNPGRNFIAVGLPGDQIAGLIDCKGVIHAPKPAAVQVWGNDLRVGGRFNGDTTDTNDAAIRARLLQSSAGVPYGSWGEYGVLAPGNVVGVASGSGLAGNTLSDDQSQWSPLTFANSAIADPRCATAKGCYGTGDSMGRLPDLVTAVDNNMFHGVTVQNGVCSIGATTVNANSSQIVRCNGTLTITGNIQLAGGPFTEQSLPQFIVIADRINIRNSVTRIDAWLVAQGSNGAINTCSDVAPTASLSYSICDNPLVVNGPTIAKTLLLRRTANADGGTPTSAPAERFNLRSDAYIWSYRQANRSGSLTTSYVRELAPRY